MRGFARINHNFIINVEYSKFNMYELKKDVGKATLNTSPKKQKHLVFNNSAFIRAQLTLMKDLNNEFPYMLQKNIIMKNLDSSL